MGIFILGPSSILFEIFYPVVVPYLLILFTVDFFWFMWLVIHERD